MMALVFVLSVGSIIFSQTADAEIVKQNMHAGVDLEITYPDSVVIEREFSISVYIQNNGWEEKQNVILVFTNASKSIAPLSNSEMRIDRLASESSYGTTFDFKVLSDASIGTQFINLLYSHELADVETPSPDPSLRNIAIPILVKEQPHLSISTKGPESIFPNAEFPFEVEITSEDIEINDVTVQIIPPKDIEFRGETLHAFSSLERNVPISIQVQLSAPQNNIATEHKLPFQIIVKYIDDVGKEKTDSTTVSLLLRPRTFMELTTDGGIWIGGIFLAPYVSIGTIIGVPLGAIFGILIRRREKKRRKKRMK